MNEVRLIDLETWIYLTLLVLAAERECFPAKTEERLKKRCSNTKVLFPNDRQGLYILRYNSPNQLSKSPRSVWTQLSSSMAQLDSKTAKSSPS